MHSQPLLLGLAGVAAAQMPGHMAVRRQLEARQTDDAGLSACAEAIASVVTGMPTAPAALTEFAMTMTETDPCRVTVPASLSSVYESYGSALASWSAEHADEYSSALAQCPDFATLTEGSGIDGPTCTDAGDSGNSGSPEPTGSSDDDGAEETGSGSGSGSATRTGSSSGSSSTSGSNSGSGSSGGSSNNNSNNNNNDNNNGANGKKNAAHRETGFAGAAIALAGFLGVVALL
jgi:cobalamin biosynthesis protein CobT